MLQRFESNKIVIPEGYEEEFEAFKQRQDEIEQFNKQLQVLDMDDRLREIEQALTEISTK